MGVYEFNFFNDKTLEKISVCVDERLPTSKAAEETTASKPSDATKGAVLSNAKKTGSAVNLCYASSENGARSSFRAAAASSSEAGLSLTLHVSRAGVVAKPVRKSSFEILQVF